MIISSPSRVVAFVIAMAVPWGDRPAQAQQSGGSAEVVRFLGGAAVGLGAHESGHLLFDVAFDAQPGIKAVRFAGIPFFAITHRSGLSPRREFSISAAGFWVQHATSEFLLSREPGLRQTRAPFKKGVLAFNVLASVAYSAAALGRVGPDERDTRGISEALDIGEPVVGAILLVPAALDTYRYFRPASKWAAWSSRAVKIGMVALVLK